MDKTDTLTLRRSAETLLISGLSVVPAIAAEKRPVGSWKQQQQQRMTPEQLARAFDGGGDAVAIVAGVVSGNVEMIDFDMAGEAFAAWKEIVKRADDSLFRSLVIEQTPSGGKHVVYRMDSPPPGNLKLASRRQVTNGPEPVKLADKPYKPRKVGDEWVVDVVLIETRGEGGLFLCDPSPGYRLQHGTLDALPTLSVEQRDILIGAAISLNEVAARIEDGRPIGIADPDAFGERPGDLFNRTGDCRAILRRHGWTLLGRKGENEHWIRPGKDERTTSATLRNDGVFFVFSSNAPPFDAGVGYSPFAVLAMLDHAGDYTAAAGALVKDGFSGSFDDDGDVDISAILAQGSGQPSSSKDEVASVPLSYRDLIEAFPDLRPPIIHGLLREGESMNVIAAPKTGKSWLAMDLAISVAIGDMWLERFRCEKGRCLIIDNELHAETTAHRLPKVAEAKGVAASQLNESLYIDNLRGRLLDINRLRPYFDSIPRGKFKVIILDAFYRFMPPDTDENDNAGMARVYNTLDSYADRLGSCFILIHHTSKGIQAGKGVTDVGAGAGSQARATDSHFVLRPHAEAGAVVLDAVVRSFAPIQPCCLRFDFPLWSPDYMLDPEDLRTDRPRRKKDGGGGVDGEDWTASRFARTFVTYEPKRMREVIADAVRAGVSERSAKRLLAQAESEGMAFRRSTPRYTVSSVPDAS